MEIGIAFVHKTTYTVIKPSQTHISVKIHISKHSNFRILWFDFYNLW